LRGVRFEATYQQPLDPSRSYVSARSRWRALGGVAGPAAFVTAWSVLGARRGGGYSPIDDPISRLAAVDAPTRVAMTAGFLAFAAGVSMYAQELRRASGSGAGRAALATALATVGIAATPLDSPLGGVPHAACAGLAYATLAATPLLAARRLRDEGHATAATTSTALGLASGACLLTSILAPSATGFWQRVGLTLGDVWIVASALRIAGK
jgi:hypothetical protein